MDRIITNEFGPQLDSVNEFTMWWTKGPVAYGHTTDILAYQEPPIVATSKNGEEYTVPPQDRLGLLRHRPQVERDGVDEASGAR